MVRTFLLIVYLTAACAQDRRDDGVVENGDVQTELGRLMRKVSALAKDVKSSKEAVFNHLNALDDSIEGLKTDLEQSKKDVAEQISHVNANIAGLAKRVDSRDQKEFKKVEKEIQDLKGEARKSKTATTDELNRMKAGITGLEKGLKSTKELGIAEFQKVGTKIQELKGDVVKNKKDITDELKNVHHKISAIEEALARTPPPTMSPATTQKPTTIYQTTLQPTTPKPTAPGPIVYYPPGTKQNQVLRHYDQYHLTFVDYGYAADYTQWMGSDNVSFEQCIKICTTKRETGGKSWNSLTYEWDMGYCGCYENSKSHLVNIHLLHYNFD